MRAWLITLCLLLCSLAAVAETEFKIITLQHTFASDLIPTIEPMIGADGTISGINNQLIVRAQPERMREIEALVAKLDAAKINRKITVSSSQNTQSEYTEIEGRGAVKVGKVTVANDRRAQPNSGRIEAGQNSRNSRQNSQQFINVQDGERAFIRVGQIVPFTQEWLTITRRFVNVTRVTDWREVSTGFAVRPRTVGNMASSQQIELEITPRIASLNGQGFVDFEELTTVVRAKLGDWVDLGGTMQNNDDVSRKIFGLRQSSEQQATKLMVKVD